MQQRLLSLCLKSSRLWTVTAQVRKYRIHLNISVLDSGFIQKAVTILKQWLTHTISNSKRQAFKGEFPPAFAVKANLRKYTSLDFLLEVVILGSKQFITGIICSHMCNAYFSSFNIIFFILRIFPHQLTIVLLSWLVFVAQKVHIRVQFYIIGQSTYMSVSLCSLLSGKVKICYSRRNLIL